MRLIGKFVVLVALLWAGPAFAQCTGQYPGGTVCGNPSGTLSPPVVTPNPAVTTVTLTPGSAPSSPANGQLWTTSVGLFARINGSTVGPFIGSTITLTGDTTGSGTTSIITTTSKVNGVSYGSSPSTNTVPVVTAANTVTYETIPNSALSNPSITLGATVASLGSNVGVSGTPISALYLTSPVLTTPTLGVAIGTSLALGGAAIGSNALAVTGTTLFNSAVTVSGSLTTNITGGGTQCVQVSNSGVLSGTGAACGSGSGAVNSVTAVATGTAANSLVITPTTGSVTATCAVASSSQVGCIKGDGATLSISGSAVISINLANANTWSAAQIFSGGASFNSSSASYSWAAITVYGTPAWQVNLGGTFPTLTSGQSSNGGGFLAWNGSAGTSGEVDVVNIFRNGSTSGGFQWYNMASATAVSTTPLMSLSSVGTLNIASGQSYQINSVSVLNATTLGSGVTASSLTSVGTVTAGTWEAAFGGTITGNATLSGNLTLSGTDNFTGTFEVAGNAMTFPGSVATLAALNIADQTLTGGTNVTSDNLGTISSGTTTIDCGASPLQYLTNGGAFTLAAPAHDGSCLIYVTNNSSAGAISFSGFSANSPFGDTYATANAEVFALFIVRVNGTSVAVWTGPL